MPGRLNGPPLSFLLTVAGKSLDRLRSTLAGYMKIIEEGSKEEVLVLLVKLVFWVLIFLPILLLPASLLSFTVLGIDPRLVNEILVKLLNPTLLFQG